MRDRLPIFCFVVLFQTSFSALNTMLLPFLRSGVQCHVHRPDLGSKISALTPPDTRAPAEVPKKRTKRQQTGRALDASGRSRADWTGSTMCDDKDTVLATTVETGEIASRITRLPASIPPEAPASWSTSTARVARCCRR